MKIVLGSKSSHPSPALGASSHPQLIQLPRFLEGRLDSFEPSAVVYLEDLQRYLVAIDDIDKHETPLLFLMDAKGRVEEQPLLLRGVERMADMESMSVDDGFLYVLSSQSLTRSEDELASRGMFVRARRSGRELVVSDQVELRPGLMRALRAAKDPELRKIRDRAEEKLDVEAHFVRNGDLYVGLKNPQPSPGVGLIVGLGSVEKLFASGKPDEASVWSRLDFFSISGSKDRIADLIEGDGNLLISTTQKDGPGRIWALDNGRLSLLRSFPTGRPEGVAVDPGGRNFLVVFDQRDSPAAFAAVGF